MPTFGDAVLAGSGGNDLSGDGNSLPRGADQVPGHPDAMSACRYVVQCQRRSGGDGVPGDDNGLSGGGDPMPR